jgi:peptidoglycan/xylan/chitin deacetylase (PgdA/CDA1 family)
VDREGRGGLSLRTSALLAALALLLSGCGGSPEPKPAPPKPTPRASPAPRTDPAAIAARARVPVLCYHQIREPTSADDEQSRTYIVRPSVFAAQMRALEKAGYTPVTGDAFVAHLARGAPLPRKPVLLTFDDASAGQYTHALPVLRRHDFVATFFVMTVVLGKPGWLTRGQVRRLDRAGMTIGSHTWDHKDVTTYADADWDTQVGQPTRDLERLVGHPVRLFAYPFGLWSRDAFAHLKDAGFSGAFQLADKLDRDDPMWTIRRIIVPELSGAELLREIRRDF